MLSLYHLNRAGLFARVQTSSNPSQARLVAVWSIVAPHRAGRVLVRAWKQWPLSLVAVVLDRSACGNYQTRFSRVRFLLWIYHADGCEAAAMPRGLFRARYSGGRSARRGNGRTIVADLQGQIFERSLARKLHHREQCSNALAMPPCRDSDDHQKRRGVSVMIRHLRR